MSGAAYLATSAQELVMCSNGKLTELSSLLSSGRVTASTKPYQRTLRDGSASGIPYGFSGYSVW